MAISGVRVLGLFLVISGLFAAFIGGISYLKEGDPRTRYLIVGVTLMIIAAQMVWGAPRFEQRFVAKIGMTIWAVFTLVDMVRYLGGGGTTLPSNWALQVIAGVFLVVLTCWFWMMDRKRAFEAMQNAEFLEPRNPADQADI